MRTVAILPAYNLEQGIEEMVLGMAHRGRLNVLANIIGKSPRQIFREFAETDRKAASNRGDVKYHQGATGEFHTRNGKVLRTHLVSNPSHLEAVDPVALGRTLAKQKHAGENGVKEILPVILHGDAAFAGQGIWACGTNSCGS
jgi:2-oxoglutarate dehydrogenase E1 component